MDNGTTTIQVTKKTRERLGALGNLNDNGIEDVIIRLLSHYEKSK